MKNKQTNKSLYLILPVLSILVVLGIGLFVIQPKVDAIINKQNAITSEVTRKAQLGEKIQKLESLDNQKTDLIAQLTAINEALPTQKDVPTLIMQIQKTAQESDVEIQSIQLSPGKLITEVAAPGNNGSEISINLSIRGNYEAIETFLGKIYRGKRLINLDSINLATGGSSDTDSGLTASIIMNTFFQPLPPKPVDETETLPELTNADRQVYEKIQAYESLQAQGFTIATPTPSESPTPASTESPSPSPTARP